MRTQSQSRIETSKSIGDELKASLDMMPLKSVLYMLAFARQHAKGMKNKRRATGLYSRKMLAELRFHKGVIKIMKNGQSVGSSLLNKGIASAIYAYTGFFYTLNDDELNDYIAMFKGKRSVNLLALPAEYSLGGRPLDKAVDSITAYVNAVPLLASQNVINTVLGIMQFESNTAIKGIQSQLADRLVKLSSVLSAKAKDLKKAAYQVGETESTKREIAGALAELAAADPTMKEMIMEMMGTESANTAKLFRIVRKKA
ncbi:MAG: hypothetical protein QXW10_04625 [Candidatus Micrarchaeaceae archaeon]